MFLQSLSPVFALPLLSAMLACLLTRPAAALCDALHVHLFTAGPSPITPGMTIASFTEATFVGYAPSVVAALSGPINTPSDTCDGLFATPSFICTAGSTPNTILGYWIDDGAANIYLAEAFSSPVPIVNPGDFIDLAIIFGLAFKPTY